MGLWEALKKWKQRKEQSDLMKIKVTSGGAFYMKSEDIFNNRSEALLLLEKLDKSVNNYSRLSKQYTLPE